MAFRLVWSPRARMRLVKLGDFIAEKNPAAARKAIRTLLERVARLRDHPQLGRPWPAPDAGEIRLLVVSSYLVYYEVDFDQKTISVLTVRHGRENPVVGGDPLP